MDVRVMMADESTRTTRTREIETPAILSKRAGVFWGAVLMLVGTLWFLSVMEVIDLGRRFADAVLPLLLMLGGLYLLAMKVGRQ